MPESRNYYTDNPSTQSEARNLQDELSQLQDGATSLLEEAGRLRASQLASQLRQRGSRARRDGQASVNLRTSPEPIVRSERPRSRGGASARRSALPTPPLDSSDPNVDSLFVPETYPRPRDPHPLSHSWRPGSPTGGLGDRNRSPTPGDHWEIMRSTITPDALLPSADSSFTSAVVSQSFTADDAPASTESEHTSSSEYSGRRHSEGDGSDSVSSVAPEDTVCIEDDDVLEAAEVLANDMFGVEVETVEGRQRINEQLEIRARDGDRFAFPHEGPRVDIGFRLIEEALNTEAGRRRLVDFRFISRPNDIRILEDVVHARSQDSSRVPRGDARPHAERVYDERPPSPHPEHYSDRVRARVREARAQIHDSLSRHAEEARRVQAASLPPQHEPLGSHPDVTTLTSRDGPEPHPVSPPTQRNEREVSEALLSGDDNDLGAMRRVVERLARRDDVPDEWWTSIGLNLSRTRPRALSPPLRSERSDQQAASDRVRSGRIRRRNSRL